MSGRPHIVVFNPDQWRGDVLGHAGNPAAVTPNLDGLVETEAVSFTRTFCQNPVCTPSRCSFMTGWYPHVRGHRSLLHMLRPDDPCLLRTLKDNGYFVWWGGKNDLVPGQHGYEAYCNVRYKDTPEDHARWGMKRRPLHGPMNEWRGQPGSDNYYSFFAGRIDRGEDELYLDGDWCCVLAACEQIQRWKPGDPPLCIYLPINYPHPPYAVEEPFFSLIQREKLPPRIPDPTDWHDKPAMLRGIHERLNMAGWSEQRWDELRATYYGMCARVDAQLGRLVEALRQAGMWDDTALFFFSDHGDYTGDYGLVEKNQNTFEDCLTRVPLVVKPPAALGAKAGVRDALVELIDFPATVEALAGIEPAHRHFGRSLVPLLTGQTQEHRDAVFCEGGRLIGEKHGRDYQRDEDLTPAMVYWPREYLQDQELPLLGKATMCRTHEFKYVRRLMERDELYDLERDPRELHNVAGEQAYAEALAKMRERMLTFYQATCDAVPFDRDKRWMRKGGS
ncbi:MAG: sulfatase-like hydrolase/transferase [Phycisphaeraceae bacterium]|nr:sulfatase-like hydrolase/transferase [Phycisphaeraceae bacterium]